MDEHYEVPGWVKGSAWELLSDESMDGQFSMFLEAAERAGYYEIMNGRGLMTVMAPDNNAFTAYLSEHNYSTVQDVPARELKELIGFHLLIIKVVWKISVLKVKEPTMKALKFLIRDYTTNSGHAVQGNRQEKLIL